MPALEQGRLADIIMSIDSTKCDYLGWTAPSLELNAICAPLHCCSAPSNQIKRTHCFMAGSTAF